MLADIALRSIQVGEKQVDGDYADEWCAILGDLCGGEDVFFAATGVTDGDLLQGVRYGRRGATTESMSMRSRSGTVRVVQAEHDRDKLAGYRNATGMALYAGAPVPEGSGSTI